MLVPGELEARGAGHAEATVLNYAFDFGLKVKQIGASRPICSGCSVLIQNAGAQPTTPLKRTRK